MREGAGRRRVGECRMEEEKAGERESGRGFIDVWGERGEEEQSLL